MRGAPRRPRARVRGVAPRAQPPPLPASARTSCSVAPRAYSRPRALRAWCACARRRRQPCGTVGRAPGPAGTVRKPEPSFVQDKRSFHRNMVMDQSPQTPNKRPRPCPAARATDSTPASVPPALLLLPATPRYSPPRLPLLSPHPRLLACPRDTSATLPSRTPVPDPAPGARLEISHPSCAVCKLCPATKAPSLKGE